MPSPFTSPLLVDVADGAQIVNTTSEGRLCPDYQFAANDPRLYQGAGFDLKCWFDISNIVTTPGTVRFRVRLGTAGNGLTGTVLADTGTISMDTTARSNFSGKLEADLVVRGIGSSGKIFCQGLVFLNNVPVGAAADPQGMYFMGSAGENVPAEVGSIDMTVVRDLCVTAQFSVANAGNQITNHIRILKALSS